MHWTLQANYIVTANLHRGTQKVWELLHEKHLEHTPEAVRRKIYTTRFAQHLNKTVKTCILDIESTGLNAPWGKVLTWCIKEIGNPKIYYDIITKQELFNYTYDKRILASMVETMKQFDHIVTYYGGDYHFDLPMVRTRCLKYNLDFPTYGQITQCDMYGISKAKLAMDSYRLGAICDFLGIKGKTPIERSIWGLAAYGHKPSLYKILTHNKLDVTILEEYYVKMRPHHANFRKSI